jgi:hypothetical protein
VSNWVLSHVIKFLAASKIVLNLDKAYIMKYITKNWSHSTSHFGYKENYIEETVITKFLCLQIDNHINWKNYIEQMIPKVRGACYAIRSVVHVSNINTFKSIYSAYFLSVIKYEIIFWGSSSNSGKIFTLHQKTVRIMAGAQPRTPCRSLFRQLDILSVSCQYILTYLLHGAESFLRS